METLYTLFPADNFSLLGVILGLPLLGAFVNGVFGRRLGKHGVRLMAMSALVGSFVLSCVAFLALHHHAHGLGDGENPRLAWTAWKWMDLSLREGIGTTRVDVSFAIDPLSATMMLVVTGVGSLIHLYSTAYMWQDPSFHRFFAYLNLFVFAMLVLILGDSMPLLFVGWEGVGLCSYLLIGFWFDQDANASAGKKAFIANRVGDFGLLVAMAMLLYYTGSLDFAGIHASAQGLLTPVQIWPLGGGLPGVLHFLQPQPGHEVQVYAATICGLMLLLGCAGKSAQIPLYVWLPDAMAGPTPVSALIHAATMVTAGVYLVCRLHFVFLLSPAVMATTAVVGATTALFAATIGLVQWDLKKVLAYSTVSQLGYMFLGVGSGAFSDGFFHVFTHAFFKACLFLGAGSVIHAMHARVHDTEASQDMRNMGGLRKHMPFTHATYLASCLAIAGVPPLSGFFSKDEILARAFETRIVSSTVSRGNAGELWQAPHWLGKVLFFMGLLGAVMTAFYMFRTYFLTFWGDFRGWKIVAAQSPKHTEKHGELGDAGHDDHDHHHDESYEPGTGREHIEGPIPHESPWQMTAPLVVLAIFAVGAGFLNAKLLGETLHTHALTTLDHWLAPVFASAEHAVESPEFNAAHAWALAVPGVLAAAIGIGFAYYAYMVRNGEPTRAMAASVPRLYRLVLDKWRIDELYEETVIGAVDELANLSVLIDKWFVDGIIARLTATVVQGSGAGLRLAQTGRVQASAAGMIVGLVGLAAFFYLPHADISVKGDAMTGAYTVQAAPGFGYRYRWDADGDGNFDTVDFADKDSINIKLEPGAPKTVKVEVINAFRRKATRTTVVERERREEPGAANTPDDKPKAAHAMRLGTGE